MLTPGAPPTQLRRRPVATPIDVCCVCLEVGHERLWVGPDLDLDGRRLGHGLVVASEGPGGAGIGHALTLLEGQELELRADDPDHAALMERPDRAARAGIKLKYDGSTLWARVALNEPPVTAAVVEGDAWTQRLLPRRREAWALVEAALGGPARTLDQEAAIAAIETATELQAQQPERPRASNGTPGALIVLPRDTRLVVLGDLHGRPDNLLTALTRDGLALELERGEATLVIVGDAAHPESPTLDGLSDMRGSMLLMDLLFQVLIRWPRQVFFLRGNHDSFSHDVRKGGIAQGVLWSQHLIATRGQAYRDAMARYYAGCPLLATAEQLVAVHAAPPRARITREKLIDAHLIPALRHELTWSRRRVPGLPGGYLNQDVKRLRKTLDISPGAAVVVGHFAGDPVGSVWRDVEGMVDHHVVYSSREHEVGSLAAVRGHWAARRWAVEGLTTL